MLTLTEENLNALPWSVTSKLMQMHLASFNYRETVQETAGGIFNCSEEMDSTPAIWINLQRVLDPNEEYEHNDFSKVRDKLAEFFKTVKFENLVFEDLECTPEFLDQFYPRFTFENTAEEIEAVKRDLIKIRDLFDSRFQFLKPRTWDVTITEEKA